MSEIQSWVRENQTLLGFLIIQAIAIVAYAVKLETRVSTMETRGAEFSVARMDRMNDRIVVVEQKIDHIQGTLDRVIATMTRNLTPVAPQGAKP